MQGKRKRRPKRNPPSPLLAMRNFVATFATTAGSFNHTFACANLYDAKIEAGRIANSYGVELVEVVVA